MILFSTHKTFNFNIKFNNNFNYSILKKTINFNIKFNNNFNYSILIYEIIICFSKNTPAIILNHAYDTLMNIVLRLFLNHLSTTSE